MSGRRPDKRDKADKRDGRLFAHRVAVVCPLCKRLLGYSASAEESEERVRRHLREADNLHRL